MNDDLPNKGYSVYLMDSYCSRLIILKTLVFTNLYLSFHGTHLSIYIKERMIQFFVGEV